MMVTPAQALPLINMFRQIKGFTLIELIMVLLIITILSTTMIPKITDSSILSQRQIIDQFIADIHQAKVIAKQSLCPIHLNILKNSYQFTPSKNCSQMLTSITEKFQLRTSSIDVQFSPSFNLVLQPDGQMNRQENNQPAFHQQSLIISSGHIQKKLIFYEATGFFHLKEN